MDVGKSSIRWPKVAEWWPVLLRAWKGGGEDNVGLLAAGVAFYAFLAFVPLLASVVLTYGIVADAETVARHITELAQVLPREVATIIADQLLGITGQDGGKGLGLLLAIGVALYGATKGAGAIITALNITYEVEEDRSWFRTLGLSLLMTVGAALVLIIAALAIAALSVIEKAAPESSPFLHFLLRLPFWLATIAVVAVGLALLYRHAPNRADPPWHWVTPGSAAATFFWLLGTLGFSLYVRNFGSYNATYGSLGGVIVFLTWLYLSAYVVLLGAELNEAIESERPPAAT